ncbi:MAG: hypothetical protein ACYCWW_04230 [Deltaproteobacteria bacterium]
MRRSAPFWSLLFALGACAHPSAGKLALAPTAVTDAGQPGPTDGGAAASGGPVASDQTLVPPGCSASVAGSWRHEDSPSYLYRATDDGTVATLIPYRKEEDGPEKQLPPGASIVLQRGQGGFSGQLRMTEDVGDGKQCPVSFDARVVACGPEKLTLRIEQSYAVGSDCKRVDTGGPDIAEHVLVRVAPGPPPSDAGAPPTPTSH